MENSNYHLLSKFTRLRKKPQQPLTDLTELYGKIANESIYYLRLEELGDYKAALQGWKALNTDVMYRLTVIEHEYPNIASYTREEANIKSGVRELYHKSLMHLDRVKKLYDEADMGQYSPISNESSTYKNLTSNRSSSFVKRSHLQHAFNGSTRKMTTTLRDSRPTKNGTSSLRSLDPRPSSRSTQGQHRVNFVPSKPLTKREGTSSSEDDKFGGKFDGFNDNNDLIDLTLHSDEEVTSIVEESVQESVKDDPFDFDFEDYYADDPELNLKAETETDSVQNREPTSFIEQELSNLWIRSPPLIATATKTASDTKDRPPIAINEALYSIKDRPPIPVSQPPCIKDRPPIPVNQPPVPTMQDSSITTTAKSASQPAQPYQKSNNSTGNISSSNNNRSAYKPKVPARPKASTDLKATKSTPALGTRTTKSSPSLPTNGKIGRPQTASVAAKKVLGLSSEVKQPASSSKQPKKLVKKKIQANTATRSLPAMSSARSTTAQAKKKAQADHLTSTHARSSRNDSAPALNSTRTGISTSLGSLQSVDTHDDKRDRSTPPLPSSVAPPVLATESIEADNQKLKEELEDEIINSLIGVDKTAAKQIFAEIVVHGDEVHWEDIAGLEGAKNSLKEAVVYPFLRPDLFRGLREPVRGMLLFGPPGTGKTMLARAVATESHSTFFSISASSLTSKYLGESEKLVRALFAVAKKLSPSIIFVDEIDSIMGSRDSDGENESSRRIKNEFLIQWSSLSAAAAGNNSRTGSGDDDDERVLVLAATNLPWSIDEAARRRFVRRQYIPLPEPETRSVQFKRLLSHQKHSLTDEDFTDLLKLTDGFSGSDITSLAKDAAMGPLRELGDKLLLVPTESIRPMALEDFKNSLNYIKPSVSQEGLKRYEEWATKFGSSGS
ncbi:hypothetical protein HG537_0D05550 [Torulaspora globosa]|uniref:AAA+ ATPase domain-containing protein n=1 Tax=Torulaspora globosa TaxID=48254 RepID=A0A7H9HS32_9SACH|nr:hypothetical protein HG537_0D05550 [Torulaspora sp. CBS 2947]